MIEIPQVLNYQEVYLGILVLHLRDESLIVLHIYQASTKKSAAELTYRTACCAAVALCDVVAYSLYRYVFTCDYVTFVGWYVQC